MIRLRSIAGIQETSSPLMTKAPAGLASRPTPPPPAAEASSPPPPPPLTFSAAITVTPFFSYGSRKTVVPVTSSRIWSRIFISDLLCCQPFQHGHLLGVGTAAR